MTTTLTASTTAQLNQGIATANAAIAGGFIIALQGNITETTQLHAIDLQSGVPLTIDGSNGSGGIYTLNGAGSRGFVVDAGSVTIQNLGLSNAVLSGPHRNPRSYSTGFLWPLGLTTGLLCCWLIVAS